MLKNNYSSLKVAIIGAGLMGYWHARYARRTGAEIIAIVDTDTDSAKYLSRQLGNLPVFSDADEMFLAVNPDIVHICTPLDSHLSLAMKAVESGVHVLIEKPMTKSAEQARLLLDKAEQNNVIICPVHQFAFQSCILQAKKALDDLGDVLSANFTVCSAGGDGRNENELDQIIADIIPHPLSIMRALWPDVSLEDREWCLIRPCYGELNINSCVGNIVANIYISMKSRPTRFEMDIYCTLGRIHLNFFHGYAVVERGNVSRLQKIIQPFRYPVSTYVSAIKNLFRRIVYRDFAYPGLRRLINDYYAAVQGTISNPVPENDILAVAIVRDEILVNVNDKVASTLNEKIAH